MPYRFCSVGCKEAWKTVLNKSIKKRHRDKKKLLGDINESYYAHLIARKDRVVFVRWVRQVYLPNLKDEEIDKIQKMLNET